MSKKAAKKVKDDINTKVEAKEAVQAESSVLNVKCRGRFLDIKANAMREVGDTWEVDEDRAKYLEGLGLVEVL